MAGRRLWRVAFVLLLEKALVATARRALFAYAPFISQNIRSPLPDVLHALAGTNAVACGAPLMLPLLLGYLSHRAVIMLCLTTSGVSCVVLAYATSMASFMPAATAFAAAWAINSPTVSALFSAVASSSQDRSALSAAVELSYGASSFVGLPLFGALMAHSARQRMPFLALALAMALLAPTLAWVIGPTPRVGRATERPSLCAAIRCAHWGRLLRRPDWRPIVALLIGSLGVVLTMEVASILFGVWLSRAQGWPVGAVATAVFAIGVADLGGELTVLACLTWRRRDAFAFVRTCLAVLALACIALPLFCALGAVPGLLAFVPVQAAAEAGIVGLMSCLVVLAPPPGAGVSGTSTQPVDGRADAPVGGTPAMEAVVPEPAEDRGKNEEARERDVEHESRPMSAADVARSDGSLESAFAVVLGLAKVCGDVLAFPLYAVAPGGILAFAGLCSALMAGAWMLARAWFPRPAAANSANSGAASK